MALLNIPHLSGARVLSEPTAEDGNGISERTRPTADVLTSPHQQSGLSAPVPPIVVHDETSGTTKDSERLSFSEATEDTAVHRVVDMERKGAVESHSFKGITTNIPTGRFEESFLSQLHFSKRGSVLLDPVEARSFARPVQKSASVRSALDRSNCRQSNGTQPNRLVRVSTDEGRLSRRVRSLYEDREDTISHSPNQPDSSASTANYQTCDATDRNLETEHDSVAGNPTSRSGEKQPVASPRSTLNELAGNSRDAHEAAGGVEDWTDVDSRDVDRWGFIQDRPTSSKRSSMTSMRASSHPEKQRAYHGGRTTLSVVNEMSSERQNGQAEKTKSRFSLSPGGRVLKSSPSLISAQSTRSAASRVKSIREGIRKPRWLGDASEMLMPTSSGNADDSPDYHINSAREARRADKWQKMANAVPNLSLPKGAGMKFSFNRSDPKLISRTWKGIPDRWRAEAWYSFLTSSASARSAENRPDPTDEELESFFHDCQNYDCADDVQIDMDVPRTIGNHIQFRKRYHGGQRFLFRVLRALSLYFPEIGYVQGMASVVATLLVYYEESRAFVMAVRLWQLRGIRKLYDEGFEGLMETLQELEERWTRHTDVSIRLNALGISASAWGPKWYLTLFNYVLPFHSMLRVWDVFMLLGDPQPQAGPTTKKDENDYVDFDVLHAAVAAVLLALRDLILEADFENAMRALTSSVMIEKDDKMMSIAKKLWERKRGKG